MEEGERDEKKNSRRRGGGIEKLGRKWRRKRMSDNILGPEVRIEKGKKGVADILPPFPPTLHYAPNAIQVLLSFDPTYASIFAFLSTIHLF